MRYLNEFSGKIVVFYRQKISYRKKIFYFFGGRSFFQISQVSRFKFRDSSIFPGFGIKRSTFLHVRIFPSTGNIFTRMVCEGVSQSGHCRYAYNNDYNNLNQQIFGIFNLSHCPTSFFFAFILTQIFFQPSHLLNVFCLLQFDYIF